jgi:hypothetical protein
MIQVPSEVVNLFIGVWAETWRGRLDTDPLPIKDSRKAALERQNIEKPIMRTEDWGTIIEASAGYEERSLLVPYSGPRAHIGHRIIDDPDPRLFLFLTVEEAVLSLHPAARALADHTWIYRRGDREFHFEAKEGQRNPVPKGRSKVDWCKKVRARWVRPRIGEAIGSHAPENIVEKSLWDIGLLKK